MIGVILTLNYREHININFLQKRNKLQKVAE